MTARNGYHTGLRALLPHKKHAKNQRDTVKENLPHRLVAYSPELARILGGVTTGAYFSQLMFLADKGNDPEGWIYKSETEMAQETGLTKREQQTARRKLLALGVIELKRGGWRNTYHFRICWEKLIQVIEQYQRAQTASDVEQTEGTEYPQTPRQSGQTVSTEPGEQCQTHATECPQTSSTERRHTDSTQWEQNATSQNREYNRDYDRENNQERTGRENELTRNERTSDVQTNETTWNKTLKILKEQVPASTFTTWLKETMLVVMKQRTAFVLVGSSLAKAWLERRLYVGICRALRDVLHQEVEVQFVTAATSDVAAA
jgi:hypothetical protein